MQKLADGRAGETVVWILVFRVLGHKYALQRHNMVALAVILRVRM